MYVLPFVNELEHAVHEYANVDHRRLESHGPIRHQS